MITKKSIVTNIILTIVTCGIYGIVWFINITDDTRIVSGDNRLSGGKAFLFTLITCGIYGYYWAYLMGKALVQAKSKYGLMADDNSILYIILQFLGLGIVNYCLIQNDLNIISDKMSGPTNTPNNTIDTDNNNNINTDNNII